MIPWKVESASVCEPSPVWCKEEWRIMQRSEGTEQLRPDGGCKAPDTSV